MLHKNLFKLLTFSVLFVLFYGMPVAFAAGDDVFGQGREMLLASTNQDSALYQFMLVGGLGTAAVTGFISRDWVRAAGGFCCGLIFMQFAMPLVGY